MTPLQQKLLQLRSELSSSVIGENSIDDAQTLAQTARIRKNLDYFIASSEISAKQKQECLEKFITFMSDDYKINPQLKDKKLQVLDEMLNDLIIKTPESEVLTIKSVDQRQSGMCAALSICRKAIAYEDKSRYVDLIMEELKDSDVMSVFDVTELGSGKKVNIPKTDVDYISEMEKGYRIIDASAHNWMHNAHASGNGTLLTEHYFAPSNDYYGIFDDSSWYLGLSEDASEKKPLLMAVIKEKEFISSYKKSQKEMKEAQQNITTVKKQAIETQTSAMGRLNSIFSQIFADKSSQDVSRLIKDTIEFYSGKSDSNEVNVPKKLSKELQSKILADYIIGKSPNITDEQLEKIREDALKILDMVDLYTDADNQLKKLKRFNTPKSKYLLNKRLFKIAAAHRIAVEEDVNLPDGASRYEKLAGLPPRDIQVLDFLKKLNNKTPVEKKLELTKDVFQIESVIPSELDSVMKTVFDKTVSEITADMYASLASGVEQNNAQTIENIKLQETLGTDKASILKNLKKWENILRKEPSMSDLGEAIRLLGYEDKFQFIYSYYKAFIASMQKGISEEQYQELIKRYQGADKVEITINTAGKKLEELKNSYDTILEKWNVPSSRMLILDRFEKDKDILSRQKLDMLKKHFDLIEAGMAKNESIENLKKRAEANNALYKFSDEETEIFDSIDKNVNIMRKYAKLTYNALNNLLYEDLENQYANIGMLNGQFWVREEGSSGLATTEQIRIIEQMTGKPYHGESDIKKAVEEIKKGQGSGIISLSVEDDDYGFHAQYVPSVTTETFTNPFNKVKITQDVVWTDNSWGNAEKEHYWNGRNGYLYTDYNNGYGWKDGFILAPDHTIGLKVDDIFGAVGYAKDDDDSKFGLFSDVILPGRPKNTYQKLYKMFNYIFSVNDGAQYYDVLEYQLTSGRKISTKYLNGLDDLAENAVEKLSKRIDKEIKTEQDFENLPPDDELKFAFEKLAVYMYLHKNNPSREDEVLAIASKKELEDYKEVIFNDILEEFASIMAKSEETAEMIYLEAKDELANLAKDTENKFGIKISDKRLEYILNGIFYKNVEARSTLDAMQDSLIDNLKNSAAKHIKNQQALEYFIQNAEKIIVKAIDEKIRIKSFDTPILANSPVKEEFINVIDKYLKPESQEELLLLIQQMQNVDAEKLDNFFASIGFEDVGMIFKDPYDYIKLYKSDDTEIAKAFSDIVTTQSITSNLPGIFTGTSAEDLYRDLYVKLSYLDAQKYVKAFKAEAFQKYKVRQAFPQPVVLSDKAIEETAYNMFHSLAEEVSEIESNKYYISFMSAYDTIKKEYSSKNFYKALLKLQDVSVDEANADDVYKFTELVKELYSITKDDTSMSDLNNALENLIVSLSVNNGIINGKQAGASLKGVIKEFKTFNSANLNAAYFIQLNKEMLAELKSKIQFYVNANIEPKYRDEAISHLNKFIMLVKDKQQTDKLEEETAAFMELLKNKHVVKNPAGLLKECVDMLMDGKKDDNTYKVLKGYLLEALRVAQQTKLQYKLVQNQHSGISSKLKEMLPLYKINLTDGTKESVASEAGMMYLIQQLKNTGDNNIILNLFLNQTGLNSAALNALINNFDVNKSKELIDETYNEVIKTMQELNELSEYTLDFFEQNDIKCSSLKETIDHLVKFIKRKYKSPDIDNKTLKSYIEYMDSIQYNDAMTKAAPSMYMPLAGTLNSEALNNIALKINSKIEFIEDIKAILSERADLILSIEIEPNSDDEIKRNKFFEQYNSVLQYIDQIKIKISEEINNFSNITQQE